VKNSSETEEKKLEMPPHNTKIQEKRELEIVARGKLQRGGSTFHRGTT